MDAEHGHVPEYQRVGAFQYPSGRFPMSNTLKKSVKVSGEMMQPMAVLITCRSQDHAQLKFLFELKKPDGLLPDTAKLPPPSPPPSPEPEVKWERLVEVLGA
jgi:hypothetical protein